MFHFRNGISHRRRTKDSRGLPDNADELATDYRNEIQRLNRDQNFRIIMNMNETFVLFDMMPRTTMEPTGSQNVDIRSSRGNQKLGCTVTLLITSDGRKAPAEINFRGLDPDGPVVEELRAAAPENVRVSKFLSNRSSGMWCNYGCWCVIRFSAPFSERKPCSLILN